MKILMIGCGGVGRTIVELLHIEGIQLEQFIIVEPKRLESWVKRYFPNVMEVNKALTKDNVEKVLGPLLKRYKPFVIDVSINVDSLDVIRVCKKHTCMYINTSVESYKVENEEEYDFDDPQDLIRNSLYARELEAEKVIGKTKTNMLISQGMNPGLCSQFAIKGLVDYTQKYGTQAEKELVLQKKYNKLAASLGLDTIHVSEIDTQIAKKPKPSNWFWNTWSCIGLLEEALDPIQVGHNPKHGEFGIKPGFGKNNIRILPVRGMDGTAKSTVLSLAGKPKNITGLLIPHVESATLSSFLTYKNQRPAVYYVYDCCEAAKEGLDQMRQNNYKPFHEDHCRVLKSTDIQSGYDSVGCLLVFKKNGIERKWWSGTVVSNDMVQRWGFKNGNATCLQVAISMWVSVQYLSNHPGRGLMLPEDLDPFWTISACGKYLGNVYSKEI